MPIFPMKPVRLAAAATRALPRWGMPLLTLLYILPGLVGRAPWKNDDAAGFGIMWTMAHGGWQDWLLPNVAGLALPEEGPLAFWLGALGIMLFGSVAGDVFAARTATVAVFLLGALSLWYCAYLLGRRADAQPLRLAFGGQPEPRDYGRTLADATLLIYLGCLGLWRSHETSAEALLVALVSFTLYTLARYAERPDRRNALLLGCALGALALTRGWAVPLALWLCLLAFLPALAPGLERRRTTWHLLLALGPALLPALAWWLAAHHTQPYGRAPFTAWMEWNLAQTGLPRLDALKYFLRDGIWFFWPAWPFAGWAVYAWRRQHQALHITLPLAFAGALALVALATPVPEESKLIPLLPPLAVLAAFGLPTMKRGAINAVDWFSVITFSLLAGILWLYWIAMQTGWPGQMARNALKLSPGFQPGFSGAAFAVALGASLGWLALVHWRLARRPAVLWRAVVLSSGGAILCWLLAMTLFLPWLDYMKSYASVARGIARHLPQGATCVETNAGPAQRASFAYFGGIPLAGFGAPECKVLLVQDNIKSGRQEDSAKPFRGREWQLLWIGNRPSDRDERFRLYRLAD